MLKVGILQLNYIVGDVDGNINKILTGLNKIPSADILVTSELAITGYPPKDLLLYSKFIEYTWEKVCQLAKEIKKLPPLLVGFPEKSKNSDAILYNSVALLKGGKVEKIFRKVLLPNYLEFNEKRYFEAGDTIKSFTFKGQKIAVSICEDIWTKNLELYSKPPLENLDKDVNLLINIAASPFTLDKQDERKKLYSDISKKYSINLLFVNQVGGNDSLVFDGCSCLFYRGDLQNELPEFVESCSIIEIKKKYPINKNLKVFKKKETGQKLFFSLKMGLSDFFSKQKLKRAIIGISGGIDSAVVAGIATHALGNKNVFAVLMPSMYSSDGSVTDGVELCKNLKIQYEIIPIHEILNSFQKLFQTKKIDSAHNRIEENLQARIRGNILMTIANYRKGIVLNTGNKSEIGVGYCTMYGDMCGGISILGDVPKILVYELANWINKNMGSNKNIIPKNIITKPPSAELKPDQKDTDNLPEYDILDPILHQYVVEKKLPQEIYSSQFSTNVVDSVVHLFNSAEFKRKQAPIEIKISSCSLGESWEMPIVAHKKWNYDKNS